MEVQSTSQQLRTQYAQRGAQHTQGGAEISRDEIPVALQSYVEQYFEQMRKQQPREEVARYSQTRFGTPRSRSLTRSYRYSVETVPSDSL